MQKYFRKVIKIRAVDSPNVRLALEEIKAGKQPSHRILTPGVLSYEDYVKRRATWSPMRQCIGLDAQFWEGADALLFPPEWLNRAESVARQLEGTRRRAKAIGIDPAEGGDKTTMAAVDEFGLIELVSKQTPDTSVITGEALAFMRKHQVPPERTGFDRGGGGQQHADRLRLQGYNVRTVGFGEVATHDLENANRRKTQRMRVESTEERYVYKNRRAEMYGDLRLLLDPANEQGFGLSAEYTELRRQLDPIPLMYDNEGRLMLPPKNRPGPYSSEYNESLDKRRQSQVVTLIQLIGHSPDEADALVVGIHMMLHEHRPMVVGVAF